MNHCLDTSLVVLACCTLLLLASYAMIVAWLFDDGSLP